MGFSNEKYFSHLGGQLTITVCRMILFEKFDHKINYAFENMFNPFEENESDI